MADSIVQDVVNQSLSVGDNSPSDAAATTTTTDSIPSEDVNGVAEVATKENGIHTATIFADLDDASARSDTDTSRAEESVAGDKPTEAKPLKKFAPTKPVSFAKYTAPKVVAANAASKGIDKVPTPSSSTPSSQPLGRPRLVAKTTSSLQQKAKTYKPAAPDPMQVWNKNRATPAPSTKHLTDEELKQQYGIHLTSRLQADAEGKEAKWADIDDDEDDWAPETIEWNDGTKTTLAGSDMPSAAATPSSEVPQSTDPKKVEPAKPIPPQFVSSVGPNATVLKIGANAEKQMAQKAAAEKSRSPLERASRPSFSNTTPAPPPSKSPWAALPPVDRPSPIEIAPQPVMPPPSRFGAGYGPSPGGAMQAPSPAREMSADDFNRTWRDDQSNQPRELFMPSSGRYEAVSEGRRRMSRNDQGFRAPAVLQRPSGNDPSAPAEPSAAFQTTRTSSDVNRRRTSSIVSGGSGQIARRLSVKSGDLAAPVFDNMSSDLSARPTSQDGPQSQIQTPAYQARHPSTDYMAAGGSAFDIEAEREKQKQMMKENGVRARQRRLEEEARLEAEKQERIKKKLAALEAANPQPEHKPASTSEQPQPSASDRSTFDVPPEPSSEALRMSQSVSQSPPKPPQPLATGEPQQYGMIKVHALDSNKKMGGMDNQRPFASMKPDREGSDDASRQFQSGHTPVRPLDNQRSFANDSVAAPEPSPKLPKPAQGPNGVGRGWGDIPSRDHRGPGNLWGISSNKALGNGTFDQTLAGYAPQDLSRTSSGAPGWSNGRTPVAGRSPHAAEARILAGVSLASPDQGPLAVDSEADTLFPVVRPAPIGPPQQQNLPASNSMTNSPLLGNSNGNALAGWNNFHAVAGAQERAESDRLRNEHAARKEEEQRTGIRRGPQYTFNETWKQVQLGDTPTQRDTSAVSQSSVPVTSFGAVGSVPTGPAQRGSRFFPSPNNHPAEGQRAATYSYPEPPRSPSPPPAEDFGSAHPAFDGDIRHPAVRFPREKAVVKLPPMGPPTPPAEPQDIEPSQATQPLTWAARAAMAPPAQLRHASTPIAQTSSWQERFNGLFDKKAGGLKGMDGMTEPSPAVETSSRELMDVISPVGAAVSLPIISSIASLVEEFNAVSKEVEEEEDLFEDRELASLPTISLPLQSLVALPLAQVPRVFPKRLDIASGDVAWVPYGPHAQYALIRAPGMTKSVRVTLPSKQGTAHGSYKYGKPLNKRGGTFIRGGKSRGTSKAS